MRIRRLTGFRAVLIALLLLSAAATASADTVRVTVDSALVWTRPAGVSFVITQLDQDTVVEVLRRVGGWYKIILPGGASGLNRTGFIRVTQVAIEAVQPLSPQAVRLAAATAPRPARKPSTMLILDAVRRWGRDDLTRTSAAFAERFAEDGSITANYGRGEGWEFDVLIGQTISGPIGMGVGGSYSLRKQRARVNAQVPHPFFFDQPRSATFETAPLVGHELALHIPVIWMPQARKHWRVLAFGGLSIFRVSQGVVTDLVLDDPYPHDTVTINREITGELKGTSVGFHAGADVSYFFSRSAGLGVGARYSRATVKFENDADADTTGFAGAIQAVAGLRFSF